MESNIRIDKDAYTQAVKLFAGRDDDLYYIEDAHMEAFDAAAGLAWVHYTCKPHTAYLEFQLIDTKKYLMAKIRYGI